jgi:hypothetical protein
MIPPLDLPARLINVPDSGLDARLVTKVAYGKDSTVPGNRCDSIEGLGEVTDRAEDAGDRAEPHPVNGIPSNSIEIVMGQVHQPAFPRCYHGDNPLFKCRSGFGSL